MTLWAITIAANLTLALWLFWRGHSEKYRILFTSLLFESFAAPLLWWIYITYGSSSTAYYHAFYGKKIISLLFMLWIIWEGFSWRNRCIRIPQELYLAALIALFVAQKLQEDWITHGINQCLRYSNIAIVCWLFWCFRGEQERRSFRYNRLN